MRVPLAPLSVGALVVAPSLLLGSACSSPSHGSLLPGATNDAAAMDATMTNDGAAQDGAAGDASRDVAIGDAAANDGSTDASLPPQATLGDYWSTNAFGQPGAKWQYQHMLSYAGDGGVVPAGAQYIVIGPKGRCSNGASPWWYVHAGGYTDDDAGCTGSHYGYGSVVNLSCDQGATWGPDKPGVAPTTGTPWACYATDGRMFYDSSASIWHYLFQCMGEDGVWNGCHLVNSSDPDDSAAWVVPSGQTNPVIRGGTDGIAKGSLWSQICASDAGAKKCGVASWIGGEGTFDIFQKDAEGYFWIDFHGVDSDGHLYRGIARTADFSEYQVNGVGGTPTDSVFDVPSQQEQGNGVNEIWPAYAAGGAGTIVQDGPGGPFYLLVEESDNAGLGNPNTEAGVAAGAATRWDLALGRQSSLSQSSWDWTSLPAGNPIFLSAYDEYSHVYPTTVAASDQYPYIFFDPDTHIWHLLVGRMENGGINGAAPTLFNLVFSANALPDGDFNTRPLTSGMGNWMTLPVDNGVVNYAVYRLPYSSSDAQQFMETNTTTMNGSIYQDVSGAGAFANLPAHFGGKFRAPAGSTGNLVVFELDSNGVVVDSLVQPFTTGADGGGPSWQEVDYAGQSLWSPDVTSVRFQMYMTTIGVQYDLDEMYINAQ